MQADRHETGGGLVVDEQAGRPAGQDVDGPDVAVTQRPDVEVPAPIGLDALGLEPVGQLDALGQVGIGGLVAGRGGREDQRGGKRHREKESEAAGERHDGLQRPWLAASFGSGTILARDGPEATISRPSGVSRLIVLGFMSALPAGAPTSRHVRLLSIRQRPPRTGASDRNAPTSPMRIDHGAWWLMPGRPPARGDGRSSEVPPVMRG